MPNYVLIRMEVSGPSDVLGMFASHITKSCEDGSLYFDFNTIIPMPKALDIGLVSSDPDARQLANESKYGYRSWYDWCTATWGTKWNSGSNKIEFIQNGDDCRYIIEFQTAWSLPDGVLNELNELYPELEFYLECVEEGGYFAGTLQFCGEDIIDGISDDHATWKTFARKLFKGWSEDQVAIARDELNFILTSSDPFGNVEYVTELLKQMVENGAEEEAKNFFKQFEELANATNVTLSLTFQP